MFFREPISTQVLYDYLSAAFNIDKTNDVKLMLKERKVVVTRDVVQKMLNIHEKKECGIPLIIEGETGVGKTFLLELLSYMWNESWIQQLKKQRQNMKVILVYIFIMV